MSEEQKKKIGNANRNPSNETRKKISESHKGENGPMFGRTGSLHPNYGKTMSEEQKLKLSKSHKGKPSSFKGKKHTEEAKRANAEAHMGKTPWNKGKKTGPHTLEHNMNIAKSALQHKKGKGQIYVCSDKTEIWLRSTFEVRVASILDKMNIPWQYEPTRFVIGNRVYIPDFLIDNSFWWEVKGYMDDISIDKLNNFYNNYPDEKLKIICLDDIEKLEELEQSNNYSINNIICLGKHINEFNKNIIISGDL